MPNKMVMGIAAAFAISAAVLTAGAEEYGAQPSAFTSASTEVYPPIHAMSYTVGANGFSGFFQRQDGKCALTLMFFKPMQSDEDLPDKSAARVQVAIPPGEKVRIGSAEGEALLLSCNENASTVSVAHPQPIASQ